MSHIPNCREDGTYNEKYLNRDDKLYVKGFDCATEIGIETFFDNEMFGLTDGDSYLGHVLSEKIPEKFAGELRDVEVETYADLIKVTLLEWMEATRDELITSCIDNMDDEEYEAIKGDVDAG